MALIPQIPARDESRGASLAQRRTSVQLRARSTRALGIEKSVTDGELR
jgi:hypothetical protein